MASTALENDAARQLAERLKVAGSPYDLLSLAELVDGVLAAPEALDPEAWTALVAAQPDAALTEALMAFKAARAGERADDGTTPRDASARLALLRDKLAKAGYGGFIVPRADAHQGEYVPPRDERLAWLTGFTGSAGLAIVLHERAAVFVDGRYTLQARQQVDENLYELCHVTEAPPEDWLAEHLPAGVPLAYDPWLMTPNQIDRYRKAVKRVGAELVAAAENPLDAVWTDQPPAPLAPAVPHPVTYAGKSAEEKRAEIAEGLKEADANAAVLSLPDSIAWLLNLRGADVPRTPYCLSFAILHEDGQVEWFVDSRKITPALRDALGEAVTCHPPERLTRSLNALGSGAKKVLVDPSSAPAAILQSLEEAGAAIRRAADPCQLPKACKNDTEVAGARAAHKRDAVALVRFLAWLDREAGPRAETDEPITEMEAVTRLGELRQENERLADFSFDTISAAGPNAALAHYRVSAETNRALRPGEIYLCDSGGQYLDGTTDVTRTIIVGAASEEMKARFTLVLKGHIAIARLRFPKGTTGSHIDALARRPLWSAGLDFDHGTGHGVGSFLGVHEGPQRISKAQSATALAPGMIVSNEPGYYKAERYGIRIENLVVVREAEALPDQDRPMYEFETLTLAPIDRRLIDPELLDAEELAWLDAYHARVEKEIGPLLDEETRSWLAEQTRPLG